MNRRQILAGLIAAPAIIKVAGIMQIKPFSQFIYVDLTPCPLLPTIAPPWAGVLWNDNGIIRLSQ